MPMDTRASRVPIQTASIWSPTSVRIASRLLMPSKDSVWMIVAVVWLVFSQVDKERS